jgi:hypothetical protein
LLRNQSTHTQKAPIDRLKAAVHFGVGLIYSTKGALSLATARYFANRFRGS